jgi:hypothetical protein
VIVAGDRASRLCDAGARDAGARDAGARDAGANATRHSANPLCWMKHNAGLPASPLAPGLVLVLVLACQNYTMCK